MPRPITLQSSSSRTALVVVEPRSMPTNVFMPGSSRCSPCAGALLLDHLEVALKPVLDIRRGKIARVDEVRFDKGRRLAGALLHFPHDQELACREAVAALDRVD